eukprot:GHUV01048728.1.p1 GENE.GHUV01048728.1~~GHUV01048728.1.p1  ORF type:complete len:313 (+),score=69.05 GHUV01048728.1:1447-2385(+)
MSERQLRPRNQGGRNRYVEDDDDDDDEVEDDEPESSDSAHESSSSRRHSDSPANNAAAAAAASGGRNGSNTSHQIKTAQRWTQEEHDLLLRTVTQFGNSRRWSEIAKHIPGRTGKQCRERWVNHMNPNSKKGSWDVAEELLLCKWHSILGSHWARITRKLEGRTENAVKNHWNAAMRAKVDSSLIVFQASRPYIAASWIVTDVLVWLCWDLSVQLYCHRVVSLESLVPAGSCWAWTANTHKLETPVTVLATCLLLPVTHAAIRAKVCTRPEGPCTAAVWVGRLIVVCCYSVLLRLLVQAQGHTVAINKQVCY